MSFVSTLIKRLFPYKTITYHISDLNNQSSTQNDSTNGVDLSIEKRNGSRQFCSLSIEELAILYEHCPMENRTLYERISPNKTVKTYIDFEYLIDMNPDIQNHHIGPMSCLKILYYCLNAPDTTIYTPAAYVENALKQFLVLEASTNEKISYHFIHANPTIVLENALTLRIFIKSMIHLLLMSVAQHTCTSFNISMPVQTCKLRNLIQLLSPYVLTLRKCCVSCKTSIPYIFIADIAYLLVRNKTNQWTTAIDTNVYLKNQQFRLIYNVKHGKNNPLVPSTVLAFNSEQQHSLSDLLKKSLITFIENNSISKICFENERLRIDSSINSNSTNIMAQISTKIELINKHIDSSSSPYHHTNFCANTRIDHSSNLNQCNNLELCVRDLQTFTTFVEKLIMSDPSHQGYIHSCVRGTYNRNILFFNVSGNYRFCPKKKSHHRRNTVAIMINTKNYTYSIRCKDNECNNTVLSWEKIN